MYLNVCDEFGKAKKSNDSANVHFAPTARIKCVFSIHVSHSPNILEKSKDNLNSAQEKNMG